MTKQVIPYLDERTWLAQRVHDITSTEAAVLFNASPYGTPFELYYAKKDGVIEQRADNDRMKWGRRLQDPIADGVAEDHGLEVRKKTEYIRDTVARIGASFDFEIVGAGGHHGEKIKQYGAGLMEIKTVDPIQLRDTWVIQDGEIIEAPPHIELQVQHQLLVSGAQWALIVALVGGNRVSVIERAYDPDLGAAIMDKVREFWALVAAGTPPAPDYMRDADTIRALYLRTTAGKLVDARGDTALAQLANLYRAQSAEAKQLESERDATRARILERIGDAARVVLDEGSISASTVKETVVPQYTRAAYRTLRISQPKETT